MEQTGIPLCENQNFWNYFIQCLDTHNARYEKKVWNLNEDDLLV